MKKTYIFTCLLLCVLISAGNAQHAKLPDLNGTNGKSIQPPAIPICMVTVDSLSKYNQVIWQKTATTSIDSFIVYRETTSNNYVRIGAEAYASAGLFTDTMRSRYFPFTGDPNGGTYRYKLQVRDTGGNYSLLSPYHNTVFITQNGGTFNWNQYGIEGDSTPVPGLTAYVLYRDDNSTGAWHSVGGVSSTQTTVTDPAYASYPHGSWRVQTMWNMACSPTTSRSNTTEPSVAGIRENALFSILKIYPNPSHGAVDISFNRGKIKPADLIVYNLLGQTVYSERLDNSSPAGEKQIDLTFLPQGVYFIQLNALNSGKPGKAEKLVIQ